MGKHQITNLLLYRWRYILGYATFAAALALLLVLAGLFIPGGLSKAEIHSALISNQLNPHLLFDLSPDQLLYLPYRLLQAGSIALFGFTSFSIKLPSLILAFVGAVGLLVLMNLWFRRNVAIIASIIAVTTTQFILTAQSGHAGITYIFWTVFILLSASLIAKKGALPNAWAIAGFILAGLSLYMPLNVYVLLALGLTAVLHPHARYTLIRKASRPMLAAGMVLFLLVISPLVIGIVNEPSLLKSLLGVPENWAVISSNAQVLFNQYLNFYNTTSGNDINPVYGLGTFLLILLGLYRMFTSKYTTKSYVISFWLVLLTPFVILNPSFVTITFVPVMLLLALGIDYLIWSWYRLFPRNPYARIFGLIPLSILVVGMAVANVDRYAYGYHYDTTVYSNYNFDLTLINKTIKKYPNEPIQLVVAPHDIELYQAYALHQTKAKSVTVTSNPMKAVASHQLTLVAASIHQRVALLPDSVLVSVSKAHADRFYLYKNLPQ